jgi:hypothetical protein
LPLFLRNWFELLEAISWTVRGFTKDCITFISSDNGQLLRIKNRKTVPEAIASAQALTDCTTAKVHEVLLTQFMPEVQKKAASSKPKPKILAYLDTPVVGKERTTQDPSAWQNKIETSQAVRKRHTGLANKTTSKTASFGSTEIADLQQKLDFTQTAEETEVAQLRADNIEVRQKNEELQRQRRLNESELIHLRLGSALSKPDSIHKRVGEEAGQRLMEKLRGGKQRKTKRVRTSLSEEDQFEERRLRQLGARFVTEFAIAAKGEGAKVVQLMNYVNDRPEMRQLRDGRQVGTEMECMANVRACIALLRQHCQTSEAQRIIQNLEMACCSGKDDGSLRAKSRAVSGSDSGGARQQLAQASTKRCEFEAHVQDGQCDDALRDWLPVRKTRVDKVEWVYDHMWHALYAGRIKVGARATKRKCVGYKQWDEHSRRIQDVTAEDVYREGMQDEEVKEWCRQYPEAAKNVSVEGLRRNICWCYEVLKEGDSQCVCPDCWSTKELFFEKYRRERRGWHSDCKGSDCDCQTAPVDFFKSTENLHELHADIVACGETEHAALQGTKLWNKECMFGTCANKCFEKWVRRFTSNAVENSSDMMQWKEYAMVTHVDGGKSQKEPVEKRGTRKQFMQAFANHMIRRHGEHWWERQYKRTVNKVKGKKLVKQKNIIHVLTDYPSATSHEFPGQVTCHQPHTSSYPVYFVYYPEEEEEELQLEILTFFNPGAEQNAKVHHACMDLLVQYYQGKSIESDGIEYTRKEAVLTDDGTGRVMIDTDGCGGQYYGRKNFYAMTLLPSRRNVKVQHSIAVRADFKGAHDAFGGTCKQIFRRAEGRGTRLATTLDFMRECRRVFDSPKEKKEQWARKANNIMCLLLEPTFVATFALKGDPTEVNGTMSVKQFIAEGAEGKLGVRERDCACDPCMDWEYSACEVPQFALSQHKEFPATPSKGWSEVTMSLKQEVGIAAGSKKRKRGDSDEGWKVKEKQLQQKLQPGMLVAIYCGTDKSSDKTDIPYWLAHVKGGQGGVAKFKVKKGFSSSGIDFKKNQWAVDLTQLDFQKADGSGGQQHTRTDTVCTVKPNNLLPVLFKESSSTSNYLYISKRTHEELLAACRWVVN